MGTIFLWKIAGQNSWILENIEILKIWKVYGFCGFSNTGSWKLDRLPGEYPSKMQLFLGRGSQSPPRADPREFGKLKFDRDFLHFLESSAIIHKIISVFIDFADYKSSRRLSGCPFFSTRAFLTQYLQIPRFFEGRNIYLAEKSGPELVDFKKMKNKTIAPRRILRRFPENIIRRCRTR